MCAVPGGEVQESLSNDELFMAEAIQEAKLALANGEVPVGALIVLEGKIIARGRNTTRQNTSPLGHAEIEAIRAACSVLKNERLIGCEMFVTKEPCTMCAGALIHARVARVVIGAKDAKYGACGTVFNIAGNPLYNHVPEILFGVLGDTCSAMLTSFFESLRAARKRGHNGNND